MKILGLMSGTSLDGLDLALCEFSEENNQVNFRLLSSETISYNTAWRNRLKNAFDASAEKYFKLHSLFGNYTAESVNAFLTKNNQTAHYIASHGHTVFHRPQLGFTTQIGCGATIAAKTGINTICDFRSLDVALNGQGAPLVPIGDRDLFHQYESCLNIGGIANISFTKNNQQVAFDVCIANMALNYLMETIGEAYDDKGKMATTGTCDHALLQKLKELNANEKSLSREWFEQYFLPLLNLSKISLSDKLGTCIEYMIIQIVSALKRENLNSVLITGGGAYNAFFIERLRASYGGEITIPEDEIIQFKEAIIFSYLGYLRVREKINTLHSVTKAYRDSIGGCVYLGDNSVTSKDL